jgi:hypothetical protein
VYIEAHQGLRGHPKVLKAARLLGLDPAEMIGRLFYLWWWCLDYAPSGDLTSVAADEVEEVVGWSGEAGIFYRALFDCGRVNGSGLLENIDGRIMVHDWDQYGGKLISRKKDDAARKQVTRWSALYPSDGSPMDIQGTSDGSPALDKIREDKIREGIKGGVGATPRDRAISLCIATWNTRFYLVMGGLVQEEMVELAGVLYDAGCSEWWDMALDIAERNGVRSWNYVRKVLQSSLASRRPPGAKRQMSAPVPSGSRTPSSSDVPQSDAEKLRAIKNAGK